MRVLDKDLKTVKTFGSEESCTDVEFSYPRGVTVSADNFILLTNIYGVHKMSLNGCISGSVGKKGNEPGQFDTPEGIVASYILCC